ncbi:hypothetical protein ACW9HL_05245 [Nocardia gipuzkoensis]
MPFSALAAIGLRQCTEMISRHAPASDSDCGLFTFRNYQIRQAMNHPYIFRTGKSTVTTAASGHRRALLGTILTAAALVGPMAIPTVASATPEYAHCSVDIEAKPEYPHESKGSPGWIVGKARIKCTVDTESLTVFARLQRRENGNWKTVDEGTQEYLDAKAGMKYTGQATVKCDDGEYRTGASGKGVHRGKPSGSIAWEYSDSVTIKCRS